MEGDPQRAEPQGRLIPVFVTARMPTKVLDDLLEQDATYQLSSSLRLHIMTKASADFPATVAQRTRPPVEEAWVANSPFLGWDIIRLNEWFLENIRPADAPWARSVFLAVDEHSERTESVDVVRADPTKRPPHGPGAEEEARRRRERARELNPHYSGDEENEPENVRCDFTVARQVATPVELGLAGLYENRDINVIQNTDDVPLEV